MASRGAKSFKGGKTLTTLPNANALSGPPVHGAKPRVYGGRKTLLTKNPIDVGESAVGTKSASGARQPKAYGGTKSMIVNAQPVPKPKRSPKNA